MPKTPPNHRNFPQTCNYYSTPSIICVILIINIIHEGGIMKSFLLRNIPDELLKAIKLKAVQEEVSMRDLIIRYIEEGLKKGGGYGKK